MATRFERSPSQRPSEQMLERLRTTLFDSIARVIPRGRRVALVGYPNHANVGDSALWLGGRKTLRHLGVRVVYLADIAQYHRDRMAELLGDGIVAIHGGGNLGDLWPWHQEFRERILADFPDNMIVQLPQSIHFDDPAGIPQVRNAFQRHKHFVLFVRDSPSAEIARGALGMSPILAPDLVFGLWPLRRVGKPAAAQVLLHRTDKEAGDLSHEPSESFDWLAPGRVEAWLQEHAYTARRLGYFGAPGTFALGAYLDWLCALRLRRGLAMLSRGSVAVSDRLHGVLLSALAGIPVVALDNRVGKISAFLDTWLAGHERIAIASSLAEALRLAEQMRDR